MAARCGGAGRGSAQRETIWSAVPLSSLELTDTYRTSQPPPLQSFPELASPGGPAGDQQEQEPEPKQEQPQ